MTFAVRALLGDGSGWASVSRMRRSPRRKAWPRRLSSGADFVGTVALRPGSRRQYFLRARLAKACSTAGGQTQGRRGIRLSGAGSRTLRRRRVRRGRQGPEAGGEARRHPSRNYAVTGLYFYDNQRAGHRRKPKASPRGRAGDHRRQPRLPVTRAVEGRRDGPGYGLA